MQLNQRPTIEKKSKMRRKKWPRGAATVTFDQHSSVKGLDKKNDHLASAPVVKIFQLAPVVAQTCGKCHTCGTLASADNHNHAIRDVGE